MWGGRGRRSEPAAPHGRLQQTWVYVVCLYPSMYVLGVRELREVERVEAVHVLVGEDRVEHRLLMDVLREGQLHQDACMGWVLGLGLG